MINSEEEIYLNTIRSKKFFYPLVRRFKNGTNNTIVVIGWFLDDKMDPDFKILVGDREVEYKSFTKDWKMNAGINNKNKRVRNYFYFEFELKEQDANAKKFVITNSYDDYKYTTSINKIRKQSSTIYGEVNTTRQREDEFRIDGWYINDDNLRIEILKNKKVVNYEVTRVERPDIELLFPEVDKENIYGYHVLIKRKKGDSVTLKFISDSKTKVIKCDTHDVLLLQIKKYIDDGYNKFISFVKQFGLQAAINRIINKLKRKPGMDYVTWQILHDTTEDELNVQRNTKFKYEPLISIVIPLYKTPLDLLNELIQSIQAQTYKNFEICLSNGSGVASELDKHLEELAKKDSRIKYVTSDKPLQISDNTNKVLEIAKGDYIAFADHDDTLSPDAFFECVKAINIDRDIEFIYSDEDKITTNGKSRFMPHFKSDFNLDLLLSSNYICHLVMVKRSLYEKVGGLDSNFDGSQDYDFVLRCVENTKNIHHIPKILYHWRAIENSTSSNPESKMYAFDAGKRVLEAHYKRCNIKCEISQPDMRFPGIYRTKLILEDKPLVSVIIPNKDYSKDLKKCIDSLDNNNTYENIEYIIVENNSTEDETFAYYETLKNNPRAKVIYYPEKGFNYSKINNFGIEQSNGEIILLLNNDTEILEKDSIGEMVSYALRKDVGVVGAKLLFPNGMIQHAGVIIGLGGVAAHAFIHFNGTDPAYFCRAIITSDLSCVTGACMMFRREVYNEVGHLDEKFEVAYNDVDYCLRVREKGYLVVFNAFAKFTHYESLSRGDDSLSFKTIDRFESERMLFQDKWYNVLDKGDEYYNPNLTINNIDFSYR